MTGAELLLWFYYEFTSGMENFVVIERVPNLPADPRQWWRIRVAQGGMRLRGTMFTRALTRSGSQVPINGDTVGFPYYGPPHTHQNAVSVLSPSYLFMMMNPPIDAEGHAVHVPYHSDANDTQRVFTHVPSGQSVRLIVNHPTRAHLLFRDHDELAAELDLTSRMTIVRGLLDVDGILEHRINDPTPIYLN